MNDRAEILLASSRTFDAIKKPTLLLVGFALQDGVCVTLEGPVHYQKGDAIITGTRGEQWPVSRDTFFIRYEPDHSTILGEDGLYRKRPLRVRAVQLDEDLTITISRGDELSGHAGDWLVKDETGDYGIIQHAIFSESYEIFPL